MVARKPLRVAGATIAWALTAVLVVGAVGFVGLRVAQWRPMVVLTGSMAPTLASGDLLMVSPQPASDVERGDIITFSRPRGQRETLSHRVVAVERGGEVPRSWLGVTTRGDANPAPERWSIPEHGTVGRTRAHLGGLGVLAQFMAGTVSRGLATALVTLLLAGLALWAIWRPGRRAAA